jgi:Leucine-rich repeat (LRR) protein
MRQSTSARIGPEEFFSILDAFADENFSKEDSAFEANLDNWVNEIPELDLERDSRMQAKEKILKCKERGSKTLVLKELNLTSLPSGIWGQLTQLETLSLRGNELSQIPDDIGNLKKLIVLSLKKNQFTEIPAVIGELESLITLYIGDNKFDEQIQLQIPNEMMRLANFKYLHLEQNRLTEIPAGIKNLENLELLDLSFNEFTIDPSLSYKKLPIDPSLSLKQKGSLYSLASQ